MLAPHCDDETLGCGGILAKYPDDCMVVVATEPDDVRMKEFKVASELLGYSSAEFLDFEDGYLDRDMHRLVGAIDRLVADYKPDVMYVPFPSMHQDHIAVYEAGVRAGRLSMTPGHHFTPTLLVYDVAAYDVNLYPSDLKWNVFESLTEEQVDRKVAALEAYGSQAIVGPHPANGIKSLAQTTGNARAVAYAEPFALVRTVLS